VYIEGFLSNHKDEINRNFLRLRMSTIDQKGKGNPISTQIRDKKQRVNPTLNSRHKITVAIQLLPPPKRRKLVNFRAVITGFV